MGNRTEIVSDEFDVIICGAGPAGCTAALALASSGLRTAMISKDISTGEKVCGDAIPAYVPKVLRTIDPIYQRAFEELTPKLKVNICRIIGPEFKTLDLQFPEYGYICKRLVFDNFLLDLASRLPYLTIMKDTPIVDIKTEDKRVILTAKNGLKISSRMLIGCDGARSIVKWKLTNEKPHLHSCTIAVRAYFDNVKDTRQETFELHFLKKYLPGYFWIFPLSDNQANVGLGMPADLVKKKRIDLKKELLGIIESIPSLEHRFRSATIAGRIRGALLPLGSHKVKISGSRFMLCGDAASLADPATGAGIGQAMVSGRFAGWHAAECFKRNDFSADFMKGYDEAVYNKIGKENSHRLLMRKIFLDHPFLLNSVINLAVKSNQVENIIMNRLKY